MTRSATILALNPGSSSVKAAVRTPRLVLSLNLERLGTPQGRLSVEVEGDRTERPVEVDGADAVDVIAAELVGRDLSPVVVAHRVVHGGSHHVPTDVDDALLADLRAAIPLAPLHLPAGIETMVRARRLWPAARHVACFDTAFHHELPEWSRRLPVAPELERAGVRRYGFHGLSLQSVLHSHPDLGDAVIAHLGSGCSVTGVAADGSPRHTTMSLTPTGGMMSSTRTGDLDPEIVLYLIEQRGFTVPELRRMMDRRSGLAAYAGGRHDLRDLLAADDPEAALAVEAFVRSAAAAIASCATALDRWSSLVFTGGVGTHAGTVRERICGRLLVLRGGVAASGDAGDASAALAAGGLRVLAVETDEEAELDRLARHLAC